MASLLPIMAAEAARAADLVTGPPIVNGRYRGTISDQRGSADADDFAQDLLLGQRFSFDVKGRTSPITTTEAVRGRPRRDGPVDHAQTPPFQPVVVLVDPDGLIRFAGIRTSQDGTRSRLDRFVVDKPGRWGVRITGRDGASGAYEVRFMVDPAPPLRFEKQRLGNDAPFFKIHTFGGFEGATLTAQLTFDPNELPVEFRSLTDPLGAEVLVPDADGDMVPALSLAKARGNRLTLTNIPLSVGSGVYRLRVRTPTGTARYDLSLKLRAQTPAPQKRPVTLTDVEPYLPPREFALAGDTGVRLQLDGEGFAVRPAPRVFFGRAEGQSVITAPDGRSLTVIVPPRGRDDVVAVTVVNPDGQAVRRELYFAYVPPPTITDVVDAETLLPIRQGPTTGGLKLRVIGTNLRAGFKVTFGTGATAAFAILSAPDDGVGLAAGGTTAPFTLPLTSKITTFATVSVAVADQFGRFNTAPFTFYLKAPPSFPTFPYTPGAVQLFTPTAVTIKGTSFEATDEYTFNGFPATTTFISATGRTINIPSLPEGSYPVVVTDRIGTVVRAPNLEVKFPPVLTAIRVISGDALGTEIPLTGGTSLRVDGASLLLTDTVTLGGATITDFINRGRTGFDFVAPPSAAGPATLRVTDAAGQSASIVNAVRYAGFVGTVSHAPAPTAVDRFGGIRMAVGDLDRNGRVDDLVVVAPYGAGTGGTRTVQTRVLIASTAGVLTDRTATAVPAAKSDSLAAETFDGTCVAIGDLDGVNGADILIGGIGANYAPGVYGAASEVRLLKNKGTGVFVLDEKNSMPTRYVPGVFAYYGAYGYLVKGSIFPQGFATAIAVGDVDKDGDLDVLVGHDRYDQRAYGISPSLVNYSTNPPSLSAYPAYYTPYFKYFSAVRLYDNRIGGSKGMVDATATRLPKLGDNLPGNTLTQLPALHCRDLVLGDIDLDGDLDLIVAWNNPVTVTAYAFYASGPYAGVSPQPAAVATQVLTNDAKGNFTNATAKWLPAASAPEFWQASRVKLADLDADGDLDLLLLDANGIDAYLGPPKHTRSALRILRNDGGKFTDITATAVPPVNLAALDDHRGDALAVRDVNGDGKLDILVSTLSPLTAADGTGLRSIRYFAGQTGLSFLELPGFLVSATSDSGMAADLVFAKDLGGVNAQPLLMLSPGDDPVRADGARLRAIDWKK